MATAQQKNPATESGNFRFGTPFLGHHNYILSLCAPDYFKEIHQFYTFYPKIIAL